MPGPGKRKSIKLIIPTAGIIQTPYVTVTVKTAALGCAPVTIMPIPYPLVDAYYAGEKSSS